MGILSLTVPVSLRIRALPLSYAESPAENLVEDCGVEGGIEDLEDGTF
jgi:hypothetical protein